MSPVVRRARVLDCFLKLAYRPDQSAPSTAEFHLMSSLYDTKPWAVPVQKVVNQTFSFPVLRGSPEDPWIV